MEAYVNQGMVVKMLDIKAARCEGKHLPLVTLLKLSFLASRIQRTAEV